MNNWSGAGGRFHITSAAVHCCPGCFPDTDVAVEAAPAGAGIHPMNFLDIETTAGFVVRHLLDLNNTTMRSEERRVAFGHTATAAYTDASAAAVNVESPTHEYGEEHARAPIGPHAVMASTAPHPSAVDATSTTRVPPTPRRTPTSW